MRGENNRRLGFGDLIKLANKDGAFSFKIIDDEAIMDNLMPDIDRRAISLQCRFYNIDRAHNPSAETARGAEEDCERRF